MKGALYLIADRRQSETRRGPFLRRQHNHSWKHMVMYI